MSSRTRRRPKHTRVEAGLDYFYIQHLQTGLFLSEKDSNVTPTRQVLALPKLPPEQEGTQLWAFTGQGQIVNQYSGLVLEVPKAADGVRVVENRSAGSDIQRAGQRWRRSHSGRVESYLDRHFVLGLSSPVSAAFVVLKPRTTLDSDPSQQWRLIKSVSPFSVAAQE
ncbi:hypothetical protein [Streptomyces sp. NBC_00467]|uniref:hypothetical protein n=1 Tax=Streptomyces sp. NBC_00467 TaxID=2975752 RepID=UPI002E196FB5